MKLLKKMLGAGVLAIFLCCTALGCSQQVQQNVVSSEDEMSNELAGEYARYSSGRYDGGTGSPCPCPTGTGNTSTLSGN